MNVAKMEKQKFSHEMSWFPNFGWMNDKMETEHSYLGVNVRYINWRSGMFKPM